MVMNDTNMGIQKNKKTVYLLYTLLFCIMVVTVFAILLLTHRTLLRYGDSYRQGYFWVVEYKYLIRDLLAGKGISMWSWSRGIGMEYTPGFFIDPFNLIAALFPFKYLETGITVGYLLRMYFAGAVFLWFCRKKNYANIQALTCGLLYAFCGWTIEIIIRQPQFALNLILFPLLVMGVDRIYEKKSPALFIFTVAYYMMWDMYFAYMAAISILMYIALRFFHYSDETARFKDFLSEFGHFIVCGLTGIAISGVLLLPTFIQIFSASTENALKDEGLLFSKGYYLDVGREVVGRGMTYDYSDMAIPMLVLLLFALSLRKITKKSTNTIMSLILFGMYFFPFFNEMYNGFSYWTRRWVFALIFFVFWCAAENLTPAETKKKSTTPIMLLMLLLLSFVTVGFLVLKWISFKTADKVFTPVQLIGGALIVILFGIMGRNEKRFKGMVAAALVVNMITISIGWNWGINTELDSFNRNSSVYKRLEWSTYRATRYLEDEDLFRVDAKYGMEDYVNTYYPSNENAYWEQGTIVLYNSYSTDGLLEFNRLVGNNYGYHKRVAVLSNANRMGIDQLLGVRYYLGHDDLEESQSHSNYYKEYFTEPDEYVGYGFEFYKDIDGVKVYKSKYDTGIGYAFDKVLPESEFMKLTRMEREQALLQAAVVPDKELQLAEGVEIITAEDLDLDVREIPYEVVGLDDMEIDLDKQTIKSKKVEGYIAISGETAENCQLVVSFDGLRRTNSDGTFAVFVGNGRVRPIAIKQNGRQAVSSVVDFDFNMGYYEEYDGEELQISFTRKGTWEYDGLHVYAMSADNFDRYAAECAESVYKVSSYDGNVVKGTVNARRDSVLFLSLMSYARWDVYVDGQKCDKIKGTDVAFVGARIPAGEHEITLKYNYKYYKVGGIASIAGLVAFIVVLIVDRKKRSGRVAK